MENRQIRTFEQLKELAKTRNGLDCYILLNGGLRSSKHIRYLSIKNCFRVMNFMDGTEQELTESQILDSRYSNIGQALNKGSLIIDERNEV
jgi:hypothetical protein